jgi:hypothetical protein
VEKRWKEKLTGVLHRSCLILLGNTRSDKIWLSKEAKQMSVKRSF